MVEDKQYLLCRKFKSLTYSLQQGLPPGINRIGRKSSCHLLKYELQIQYYNKGYEHIIGFKNMGPVIR